MNSAMVKPLAFLTLLFFALTAVALADDFGPRRDVAAIRRDLPILLEASAPDASIRDVVVRGDGAVVTWTHRDALWIGILKRRFDRWWLLKAFGSEPDGAVFCCGGVYSPGDQYGPEPRFLVELGVDPALAELAKRHIAVVAAAAANGAAACPPGTFCPLTHADGYMINVLSFQHASALPPDVIYHVTVAFAANDAAQKDRITDVNPRAPTEAESWLTPGGNAYAFFSGNVSAAQPVHVQPGTTIDVWFPFVLDPSLRYSLSIGVTRGAPMAPVTGTLSANTLHFTLPALVLEPGAELMGEIDGD